MNKSFFLTGFILIYFLLNPITMMGIGTKNYEIAAVNNGKTFYCNIVSKEDRTVEIVSKTTDASTEETSGYGGNVTIPAQVTYEDITYTVIGIGYPFALENRQLTGISIPSTLKYIKNGAFADSRLSTINFPSNSSLEEIGPSAFSGSLLTTITLPASVRKIGRQAFDECGSLTYIKIQEGVTEIPPYMCYACTSLKTVILPSSIVSVGEGAFAAGWRISDRDDKKLTSVLSTLTLPANITYSGSGINFAFMDCEQLTNITCATVTPFIQNNNIFPTVVYNEGSLTVPSDSRTLYEETNHWNKFSKFKNSTVYNNGNLQCDDLILDPEESKRISFSTTFSSSSYIGFSFDVVLPDHITITDIKLNEELSNLGFKILAKNNYSSNIVRVVVGQSNFVSINNSSLKENFMEIEFTTDLYANQDTEIKICNFLFVNVNGTTYTINTKKVSVSITNIPIYNIEIIYDPEKTNLRETESLQLGYLYSPDATQQPTITWESSQPEVATVNNEGLVKAHKAGITTITVVASNNVNVKSASIEITVKEPLYGDANDNGIVNVADVVTIGNKIAGYTVDNFCMITADYNKDGHITVTDLNATVNIIMGKELLPVNYLLTRSQEFNSDYLFAQVSNDKKIIKVGINKSFEYSSLQADIHLPEGMIVKDVTLGDNAQNHSIIYNVTEEGILKVVIFSFTNTPFNDLEGSLFDIQFTFLNSIKELEIDNIIASDEYCLSYNLDYKGLETASIYNLEDSKVKVIGSNQKIEILNAYCKNIMIFDIAGRMIISGKCGSDYETLNLPAGIYLIKVNNDSYKVRIR